MDIYIYKMISPKSLWGTIETGEWIHIDLCLLSWFLHNSNQWSGFGTPLGKGHCREEIVASEMMGGFEVSSQQKHRSSD